MIFNASLRRWAVLLGSVPGYLRVRVRNGDGTVTDHTWPAGLCRSEDGLFGRL